MFTRKMWWIYLVLTFVVGGLDTYFTYTKAGELSWAWLVLDGLIFIGCLVVLVTMRRNMNRAGTRQ